MKKTITVSADQFQQMGWPIPELFNNIEKFKLTICNDPEARGITFAYVNEGNCTVQLPEYEIDYFQAMVDLDDMDLLPNFLRGQGLVVYNDQERQKSSKVFAGEVANIIGVSQIDLMIYSSFEELNADLSGCSFAHIYDEPEFELPYQE